ncbi:hypothetical protein BN439_0483 [Erwinia amylovora Ea644]|nr:hypothetical protein BN439_0483 [Erwinia amylovora Ea644]CCP05566.1 hypothetical protein BN440_0514 [Erwinia amylovora MR1]
MRAARTAMLSIGCIGNIVSLNVKERVILNICSGTAQGFFLFLHRKMQAGRASHLVTTAIIVDFYHNLIENGA